MMRDPAVVVPFERVPCAPAARRLRDGVDRLRRLARTRPFACDVVLQTIAALDLDTLAPHVEDDPNMDTSEAILGHYAAAQLNARIAAPVLIIGRDTFTRLDLARIECFNFIACSKISGVLSDLSVKDTRYLYDEIPPYALAIPGIGAISLAVLGAAFEVKGIGGQTPLLNWCRKHQHNAVVTFDALKHAATTSVAPRAATRRRSR